MSIDSSPWDGFKWIKVRPAGLSDEEEDQDEEAEWLAALQEVYYSEDEEYETKAARRRHGWIYRITFSSGLQHDLLILTSFLIFCGFANYDPEQSTELMRDELINCCWTKGYTAAKLLEEEFFCLGLEPTNFLAGLHAKLSDLPHILMWI